MNKLAVFVLGFSAIVAAALAQDVAADWKKAVDSCAKDPCQWACSFEKLELFNKQGQMQDAVFIQALSMLYPKDVDKVKSAVAICKTKVDKDRCKSAKQVGECMVAEMGKAKLSLPNPIPSS